MPATSLATINSGFAAAFELIDGSGDYHFDLPTDGKVEYREPAGPPNERAKSPYVCYWFGDVDDIRDGPYADLSQYGQTLEYFVLGRTKLRADRADSLADGWALEADIKRALHASRTLPVSGVGSVYDLTFTTRVIHGHDLINRTDGVYVFGSGTVIWARS